METIRILRVIARLNVGGPAIHTILLADAFRNSRYTTRLVAGYESPDEGNMDYLAEEHGITVHRIPSLQREINLWKDTIAFFRLVREILTYQPHLIHTHTAKAGFIGRSAALFCRLLFRRRLVLVHTFHGHV
ncbi:MAG: glycosyltransferase, partial [Candidatus Delongbacteria bacterium]|nr:glycosyltransferase [Candidatus Delongbacteria bacterium]